MQLTDEIKKYINQSILCWVATVSKDNIPNVSPKEIFKAYHDSIIIANIASPKTIANIEQNDNVCISFIDILVQKGFQVKGKARIITKKDEAYANMENELLKMTGGNFPFSSITQILPTTAKPIISPKYILYPETTEAQQIESAKKVYGLNN